MKDVQSTGEASSPQKRTSSTLKTIHFYIFLPVGHFCPLGSGSGVTDQNQCGQIRNTENHHIRMILVRSASVRMVKPISSL